MPERITLFNPRDIPVMGMRSFTDPTALKPGEVALLQNARVADRTLKARRGTSRVYNTDIRTSGLFRGAASLTLNGTNYWFAAYWHVSDSDLRVYYSTDSGTSWTEATTAYRTSRFLEDVQNENSVAAHDVQFAQVYDRILQRDVAIIQNGVEPPRIFDPSAASGLTCVRHQTIPPPDSTSIQKVAVYGLPYNPWSCSGDSQNTITDSAATDLDGSYSGSTKFDYFQLVIKDAVATAATTKVTGFTAVDMSLARQLWFVCETDYDQSQMSPAVAEIWDLFKVEISEDDSTYHVVWDPSDSKYTKLIVDMDTQDEAEGATGLTFDDPLNKKASGSGSRRQTSDDVFLVSFPLDSIPATSRDAIRYIKFTFVGTAADVDADITTKFYYMGPGGVVPGDSEFVATFRSPNSRSESRPLSLPFPVGAKISGFGGSSKYDLAFPVNASLYYTFDINYAIPSNSFADTYDASEFVAYRRVGTGDYHHAKTATFASYTSDAWTCTGPGQIGTLSVDSTKLDYLRKAPDEFHRPIPSAAAMVHASSRLWCGNISELADTPSQTKTTLLDYTENDETDQNLSSVWEGVAFTVGGSNINADGVQLYLKTFNTPVDRPNGKVYCALYTDSGSTAFAPSTFICNAGSFKYGDLTSSYAAITLPFSTRQTLSASTKYWIVMKQLTQTSSSFDLYMDSVNSGTKMIADGTSAATPSWTSADGATGRLLVFAYADSYKQSKGELFASRQGDPFRFREVTDVDDPNSPIRDRYEGEIIRGLGFVSASLYGSVGMYVFTDKSVGFHTGYTAEQLSVKRKILEVGCVSGRTIQTWRNSVYFVDSEMQVRRMRGGQVEDLSRDTVEDLLQAVSDSRRQRLASAIFDDKYYLAYGTDNSTVLVFDERLPLPYKDSFLSPMTAEGLLTVRSSGATAKLIAFNTKVYRYEDPSASTEHDTSTLVSVALTTAKHHLNLWDSFTVKRIGVVSDDVNSGTLSCAVTYQPNGAVATHTASLDVSSGGVWRWSTPPASATAEPYGCTAQFAFTATMAPGKKLFALVAELEKRSSGADAT